MEYMSAKEAAERWNISARRVQALCAQGRILGAERLGNAWAIPITALKPKDDRYKGNHQKATGFYKSDNAIPKK